MGYSPEDRTESDTTEATKRARFSLSGWLFLSFHP